MEKDMSQGTSVVTTYRCGHKDVSAVMYYSEPDAVNALNSAKMKLCPICASITDAPATMREFKRWSKEQWAAWHGLPIIDQVRLLLAAEKSAVHDGVAKDPAKTLLVLYDQNSVSLQFFGWAIHLRDNGTWSWEYTVGG
jgi:hypothetical protein